jgi:hypothetical protein
VKKNKSEIGSTIWKLKIKIEIEKNKMIVNLEFNYTQVSFIYTIILLLK